MTGPVVLIQDVHRNYEAQSNIAFALGRLVENGTVGVVALEGAFFPYDLSRFRAFPNQAVVNSVGNFLLKKMSISGPVFALLTAKGSVPFLAGIDERTHYRASRRKIQREEDQQPHVSCS